MSDFLSATGFMAPAPEALAPYFPEYQITNLVATGGMGAVYRAIQTSLAREVAIKILPFEFGSDAEYSAAFEAEAKAMARLNHPNLIAVYDFGEVNGMLFIVMEFVAGQSLHEACHGMPLEQAEAIRLITGVAQGLAHAHDHGILHRDIKPANILLDGRLQPKIGDFGLARPVDRKIQEGEAIFGTPGYTAPEVLAPPHQVDQRADIFSLGVLLHELLTGKLPLDDPRPPSLICQCDPRLDKVVRRASHSNPNVRYQSAYEIVKELEAISTVSAPRLIQTQHVPMPAVVMGNAAGYSMPRKSGNSGLIAVAVVLALLLGAAYYFRDYLIGSSDKALFNLPDVAVDGGDSSADPGGLDREQSWNQGEQVPDSRDAEPELADPSPVIANDPPDRQPEPVEPVEPVETLDSVESAEPTTVVVSPPPVMDVEPPEPVATATAKPIYDVEGLFGRARSMMRDQCKSEIERLGEGAHGRIIKDYKRELEKGAKENLDRKWWDAAAKNIEEEMQRISDNGGRLPPQLDSQLKIKPWAKEIHEEYLKKQDDLSAGSLSVYDQQAKTYIRGLDQRIEKLRASNDPVAIEMIQQEIDRVRSDPGYFRRLMLQN